VSDRRYAVVLPRDVLTAEGPEAEAYLQGQLSQDVAALPDGASAWSWLLAPNGKVDCLLRISRISAAEWLLDTDAGWGDAALARLQRFKLRTKVELAASGARVVGLRGPGWDAASGWGSPIGVRIARELGRGIVHGTHDRRRRRHRTAGDRSRQLS